jgi:hypothetical protein
MGNSWKFRKPWVQVLATPIKPTYLEKNIPTALRMSQNL